MKKQRPPIVTVLGHVDHGKTTLLDEIRKSKVASGEAGGITQSIGASSVETATGDITFIDTPGHAAFSKMRSRGARLADIAVLVVAADDGVMPQTKEAISFIKEAKIPFVVALTKMDLPSANPESAKGQLEKEEVFLEGRGGDVPAIEVSAKKGTGIKELLEIINLVAEVNEIKGSEQGELMAVVIETGKDKRGMLVSAVVRNGTLKVGQEVTAGSIEAKVRGIFDQNNKSVKSVKPGYAGLILGFSSLPRVGTTIQTKGSTTAPASKEHSLSKLVADDAEGKIAVVIRAQNQGVLEAILEGIPEKIEVVDALVGDPNESDIFLAKSTKSKIIIFGSRVSGSVKKLAEAEGVDIGIFDIIYELFKHLEELVAGGEERFLGKAEIIKMFPMEKAGKNIAGCVVSEGVITKSDTLILAHADKKVGQLRVVSMKKGKKEIDQVKKGEEFGIYFEPQFDFKPHDVILSVAQTK